MRSTNPNLRLSKTNLCALFLFLITSMQFACKSSVEENLQPERPATETATDAVMANYVSSSVNFVSGATLKSSFSFPIGSAVVKERLDEAAFGKIMKRDFSSLTIESGMNFKGVHPEEKTWTFEKNDIVVNFALANKMRVHGQTLIYPKDSMMPTWVLSYSGDKTAWKKIMKTHIQTLVNHYKGKVFAWDVINESVNDNGTLRDNIWLRKLGPEYILLAFQYAHEANPDALLFLNDYGQEYGGKKMATLLNIVAQLKAKKIKVNMGFQMHTVLRVDVNNIIANLAKAAATGNMVYISELDVSVRYQKPDTFTLDATLANAQGDKVKAIVKAYMNTVPKNQQYGITVWGISDINSFWNVKYPKFNHDYPLLFDGNYNPKPAYKGFLNAGLGK